MDMTHSEIVQFVLLLEAEISKLRNEVGVQAVEIERLRGLVAQATLSRR